MATSPRLTSASYFAILMTVLAGIAAAVGIFGAGWKVAGIYGKAEDTLHAILLNSKLIDKEAEIRRKQDELQALQARLADVEKQRDSVTSQLRVKPTDADWDILCQRSLELYVGISRAFVPIAGKADALPQQLSDILDDIFNQNQLFHDTLMGAGVLQYKEIAGVRWYYFPRSPTLYGNQATGEFRLSMPK